MSMARHHLEWQRLIDVAGPFLSMPVLLRVFPQGLDAHDPDTSRRLRVAHEEWLDVQGGLRPDPAIHRAWIRFVLQEVLEFPQEILLEGQSIPGSLAATVAAHGETLRPDLVLVNPQGREKAGSARMLVTVLAPKQDPERVLADHRWKASPVSRMTDLLRATDVRLGLVTNGDQWTLVYLPRADTTGTASFYAHLFLEEPLSLQAFRSLLGVRRFFGVPDKETLEALYEESAQDQQEITDQLGLQVRHAVEQLVQALDRIDQDRGRKLLSGWSEVAVYEAACTVMMRLVFLFAAEEKGLLLRGDPFYDAHYAVGTFRALLREAADKVGEEVLERRCDAWSRLLATFRAIHGGVQHETMRLPAYGGSLFDPDRFPFLEGRPAGTSWRNTLSDPLPIHNRTVLHLLEALQLLQVRVPGGGPAETRRLSFKGLDVENIGHVYEGLLDHTAVRARGLVLGFEGSKGREPEIPLSTLKEYRAKGDDALVLFLSEATGRSDKALKKGLYAIPDRDPTNLLTDVDVRPYASLVRRDPAGWPAVLSDGSLYVTEGTDRRATGTHYTPKELTQTIVRYALEPLVYEGPADGWAPEAWKLRSPREILGLKVCDMAMGSGAFLVQTCRWLAERLVEAWEEAEASHPGAILKTPEGDFSLGSPTESILPRDAEERLILARRLVADRCLYGVDKNPMAVEMAKLSLWLVTMQKGRPFTFVDHALRNGDSLLGLTSAEQVEKFHPRPKPGMQTGWVAQQVKDAIKRAREKRAKIESFVSHRQACKG